MSSRFGFSSFKIPEYLRDAVNKYFNMPEDYGKYPSIFSGFVVRGKKIPKEEVKKIKRVVWLKMRIFLDSGKWTLEYTEQATEKIRGSELKTRQDLDDLLTKSINFQNDEREDTDRSQPAHKDTETHLSIRGNKRQLVIISFDDDANIQFNRDGAGISTSFEQSPAFLEAGLVHKGPPIEIERPKQVTFDDCRGSRDNCKTAYFIVDPSKRDLPRREKKNKQSGMGTDRKAFNIHLDLVGERKLDDGSGNPGDSYKYYIPIIVDPDVRYPGGFGGG
jgi:hypothetical protein